MDALMVTEMLKALLDRDVSRFIGFAAIFFVIWLEVRGVKKAVKNLTLTIGKSFAEGEKRFDTLEHQALNFEHRLTVLEQLHP